MIRCECGEVDNLEIVKFCGKCGTSYITRQDTINLIKEKLKYLSDEERLDIFSDYCQSCGCNNPQCQCWNDE